MNLSQCLEGLFSKTINHLDERIKNGEDPIHLIEWLNENLIKEIFKNNSNYYNKINNLIEKLKTDEKFKYDFIKDVKDNNLFIEAPSFGTIDIKDILNKNIKTKENVILKKELITFMVNKLKIDIPFEITDTELENIFCVPIYITKLNKLSHHIISARDLGVVKAITQQPLKGKRVGGGAKVGQMEREGLEAHGISLASKELSTVKSDHTDLKQDFIEQLIATGEYHLPKDIKFEGGTKKVVKTYLDMIS